MPIVFDRIILLCIFSTVRLYSIVGQSEIDELDLIEEINILDHTENTDVDASDVNKIHLNSAGLDELSSSALFSNQESQAIINNRIKYGSFLCLEELQQLRCFTKAKIRYLSKYVIIEPLIKDLRLKTSEAQISIRHERVLEKSKAYDQNKYLGSPDYFLIKYKAKKQGVYDIGFHLEKYKGEKLVFSQRPYLNFDHQRFYLNFYKPIGPISQFVLGDFNINMGQGLISQSQLRMTSSSSISAAISPSHSISKFSGLDENRFLRGIALKMRLSKSIYLRSFLSKKNFDALVLTDESTKIETIGSLQLSGYHRTATELERKNNISAISYGNSIKLNTHNISLGLNQLSHNFDKAISSMPSAFEPIGLTQDNSLYSIDIRSNWNNMIGFGELALNNHYKYAAIAGLIVSLGPGLDLAFIYRDNSPSYNSFFGGAISHNSTNQKKRGTCMKL